MKKIFKTMILTIALTTVFSVSVFARNGYCGYKGCERSTANCHNGTVYCDVHAAQHAREAGYKTCSVSGCYDQASKGSSYCWGHTCSDQKCTNRATSDSRLCSNHKCKYSGCGTYAYYTSGKYKGYCNNHAWQLSGQTSNSKTSTKSSNKSSNSSKKSSRWDSYDKGYEDVWLDDDYDWDRYQNDKDYADGVDDAMDDWDW